MEFWSNHFTPNRAKLPFETNSPRSEIPEQAAAHKRNTLAGMRRQGWELKESQRATLESSPLPLPLAEARAAVARAIGDLFKNLLPLASFGGAPYGLDETGVVKCVFKAGCAVGALHADRGQDERRPLPR